MNAYHNNGLADWQRAEQRRATMPSCAVLVVSIAEARAFSGKDLELAAAVHELDRLAADPGQARQVWWAVVHLAVVLTVRNCEPDAHALIAGYYPSDHDLRPSVMDAYRYELRKARAAAEAQRLDDLRDLPDPDDLPEDPAGIVYVVARAATQPGSPWTVWAVPAANAMRALRALDQLTARSNRTAAWAVANEANAREATT